MEQVVKKSLTTAEGQKWEKPPRPNQNTLITKSASSGCTKERGQKWNEKLFLLAPPRSTFLRPCLYATTAAGAKHVY